MRLLIAFTTAASLVISWSAARVDVDSREASRRHASHERGAEAQERASDGWQIPANAAAERNPIPRDESALAKGQSIYKSRCQRCHGPQGRGDGPEADPANPPGNLADPARAARNPDGVVFYKVWNGRRHPKMPAFKTELSREDVWLVTHYVASLRR